MVSLGNNFSGIFNLVEGCGVQYMTISKSIYKDIGLRKEVQKTKETEDKTRKKTVKKLWIDQEIADVGL